MTSSPDFQSLTTVKFHRISIMRKFFKIFFLCLIFTNFAQAQTLPKDSPEVKQLIAMGYEIMKEDPGDRLTVADNGSSKIIITKTSERTAIFRSFTREKKLDSAQELELLKVINRINTDLAYQVSISDSSISFCLYDFGTYNPKNFSKLIRLIEQVDTMWDKYPALYKYN